MKIDGSTFLVTGGASGLGRAGGPRESTGSRMNGRSMR
jgi:short-subunit dehydrogenase involved in D-alanine esterification of teichoic acids